MCANELQHKALKPNSVISQFRSSFYIYIYLFARSVQNIAATITADFMQQPIGERARVHFHRTNP